MALLILYIVMWGKQDINVEYFDLDRKSLCHINSAVSKNRTSLCGTISIVSASNWLRQCCRALKLVCRIHPRGG
jgi:hypothetical protein